MSKIINYESPPVDNVDGVNAGLKDWPKSTHMDKIVGTREAGNMETLNS